MAALKEFRFTITGVIHAKSKAAAEELAEEMAHMDGAICDPVLVEPLVKFPDLSTEIKFSKSLVDKFYAEFKDKKGMRLDKALNDLCEPDMSVTRENERRVNEIRAAEKGFQLPIVEHMDPIPAHSNPFHYDSFNMGTDIPGGILVMHAGFQRPESPRPVQYLIVINQRTGQRIRIRFQQPTQYRYRNLPKHAGDWCVEGKDDLIGRDGVLEWCTSEADARAMFTTMREHPQFSTLVAREFEKDDTTIMAYTKD